MKNLKAKKNLNNLINSTKNMIKYNKNIDEIAEDAQYQIKKVDDEINLRKRIEHERSVSGNVLVKVLIKVLKKELG